MATRKIKQIRPPPPRPSTVSTRPPSEPYGTPWPSDDFEASPYSPAGELLGMSRLAHGITSARGWRRVVGTALVVALLAPIGIGAIWMIVNFAVHRL